MTVFHWDNHRCIASFAFNPGEAGLDKFSTYLRATENTPVRLLVDLIEEDFNKETIPHVGAKDRKAIINRLVDRHYRKSRDFVNYRVIGREDTGRKDDIILYSVLSNPSILDPWLRVMEEQGTSLCGIWSLPLLTHRLYRHLDIYTPNAIVVSQQVPSNLRQTFLKNGRFESSRSAVVNLEEATIGEYIATEVEQTIRFLSNQRNIGFDEKIEIHIICRQQDIAQIQNHCHDGTLRTFKYHNIEEIHVKLGSNHDNAEYCNSLYSYLCSRYKLPVGHYGNRKLFENYYSQLSSIALYVSSIVLLLTSIIFSFYYYSNSLTLDEETITLNAQTSGINRDYEKQLAGIESKLSQAQIMSSSVDFYEKVQSTRSIAPQNLMTDVSRTLSPVNLQSTQITGFSWKPGQALSVNPLPGRIAVKKPRGIDYSSDKPVHHVVSLSGNLDQNDASALQLHSQLNLLVKQLNKNEHLSELRITRQPVDPRSDSQIQNEHGFENNISVKPSDASGFELEFIMQGRSI